MGASTRMYKQFKANLDSLAINPSRTWGSMPCIRRGCIEGLECLLRCRDAGKESFYRECGKGYIAKESGQQREGEGCTQAVGLTYAFFKDAEGCVAGNFPAA